MVEAAKSAPWPDLERGALERAYEGAGVSTLSYREAVTAALAAELERDPSVVVLGEDVVLGGVWVTTPGLAERFGDRVIDTPISELAFTGAAFGAAVREQAAGGRDHVR